MPPTKRAEPLNPMRSVANLFQTHPPIEQRLLNLIGQESTGRVRTGARGLGNAMAW